jgi:cytochrome P450
VLSDEPQAAGAGEAARAAAARTHAARSAGLAAAWAASKATRRADAWAEYDRMLDAMIEEARATAPAQVADWGDFADQIESEFT